MTLGPFQGRVDDRLKRLQRDRFASRLRERDASLWSSDPAVQRTVANRLGWLDLPADMPGRLPEVEALAADLRDTGFQDVVLLGMGGSSLAPEVMRRTFGSAAGYPRLTVLDTTDPASIRSLEGALDVERTLFVVSSKSGSTVEVASLFAYFHSRLSALKGDSAGENFIAITDEGTPLQQLAAERRFRRTFINPGNVGGRFSALSYFGLVPAALSGVDVRALLARAAELAGADATLPGGGVWLGAALGELAPAGRDKLTLVASPAIAAFGCWVEQLVAESLGKDGKGILPVDGEPPADPSAYGDDRVFVHLRLQSDATRDGAMEALAAAGQPLITLHLRDPFDLGGEFFRWEVATAVAGAVIGVNPFDEPNVAESKANTQRLLDAYHENGGLPEGEPSARRDGVAVYAAQATAGLADALGALVVGVRPGDYIALAAYLPETPAVDAALQAIRTDLRDGTRAVVTLGYGPRYLHSTGQLHKGGGDNGVFLLLTVDDAVDLDVPGARYTFGVLKRAQALGDLEALRGRGRRVLRLHLTGDVEVALSAVRDSLRAALTAATAG